MYIHGKEIPWNNSLCENVCIVMYSVHFIFVVSATLNVFNSEYIPIYGGSIVMRLAIWQFCHSMVLYFKDDIVIAI